MFRSGETAYGNLLEIYQNPLTPQSDRIVAASAIAQVKGLELIRQKLEEIEKQLKQR